MEVGREGGSEGGTLGTDVVALGWGQWGQMGWHRGDGERMGGTEGGTLGTDGVALGWGQWGQM